MFLGVLGMYDTRLRELVFAILANVKSCSEVGCKGTVKLHVQCLY